MLNRRRRSIVLVRIIVACPSVKCKDSFREIFEIIILAGILFGINLLKNLLIIPGMQLRVRLICYCCQKLSVGPEIIVIGDFRLPSSLYKLPVRRKKISCLQMRSVYNHKEVECLSTTIDKTAERITDWRLLCSKLTVRYLQDYDLLSPQTRPTS